MALSVANRVWEAIALKVRIGNVANEATGHEDDEWQHHWGQRSHCGLSFLVTNAEHGVVEQ